MAKSDVNSKMGHLWKDGLLLDYTIEVADKQFRVHRVVMASVSDYFNAMLTEGIANSQEDRVRLDIKGVSSLAVQNVIEFIYTGQFGSHKASTDELLTCARYLQIPAVIDACTTSTMSSDVGLAEGIHTLWEQKLLFDFTIKVENKQYKVHKVVMAANSAYFKTMLTGWWAEDEVQLEGLSSHTVQHMIEFMYRGDFLSKAGVLQKSMSALRDLIEFMYRGQLGATLATLEDLLACAVYLQVPTAIKACTTSLCEELDEYSCFRIRSVFKFLALDDGFEHTTKFIKQNIGSIMQVCDPKEPTYDDILLLFDTWNRSEWGLFLIIRKWLIAVSERMTEHVDDLMSRIRFCLMSRAKVTTIKGMEVFSKYDGQWKDLVEKALIYHNLPTHQKVLYDSEQSRVRSDQAPVCFQWGPKSSLHAMEEGSWVRQEMNNPPYLPLLLSPRIYNVEANNFLIVCYNTSWFSLWYIYDPRNSIWSTMPSLDESRTSFALVYHDQHLYVLGGMKSQSTDNVTLEHITAIERYDFQSNTWALMHSRLPVPVESRDAISVGSKIYLTSTSYLNDGDPLNGGLDCFEPDMGHWTHVDVPYPGWGKSNGVSLELEGEMVVAGLTEDFKLLYYKPSVEQWFTYGSCPMSPKTRFLQVKGNVIFLFGFHEKIEINSRYIESRIVCNCVKWMVENNQPTADALDDIPLHGNNVCLVLLSHPCKGK